MSESTTLATVGELSKAPTEGEIEQIKTQGRALVERKKEINKLARMMEGLEWGNVKGVTLSSHTRYALAEFCYITRANPQLHIDVLGGRPYLNAQYWTDLMNAHEHYIGYDQVNISPSVSALLRKQAEEAMADLKAFAEDEATADELRREAARLRAEAREIDRRRMEWGAPDHATHVYETIVRRYAPRAPIADIVASRVDGEPFIQEIRECNWTGNGKNDPVGNAEPAKTARTRSLRRAAVKAFSAWLQNFEKEIEKAERAVEAEWRIIEADEAAERAKLPAPGETQAVRAGAGEPEAANASAARPLPVEGEPSTPAPEPSAAPAGTSESPGPEPAWDRNDARKRFFATLRDAGIEGDDARKAWSRENGLPESTKDWNQPEFDRALELLVAPTREKVAEGCRIAGLDPDRFAQELLGHAPDTLRDYLRVLDAIHARLDGDDEPGLGL